MYTHMPETKSHPKTIRPRESGVNALREYKGPDDTWNDAIINMYLDAQHDTRMLKADEDQ